METKKENFFLKVDNKMYLIMHEYVKPRKEQKEFNKQLSEFIIEQNKETGFIPYNNFECSIRWKLLNFNFALINYHRIDFIKINGE